jgi:hypothetical protein
MNELDKKTILELRSELNSNFIFYDEVTSLTDDQLHERFKSSLTFQKLQVRVALRDMWRTFRQSWCLHTCHLYRFDGTPNLHSADDGKIEARCYKCGAICRADYGLALPGFKMGKEPLEPS